MFNWPVSWTGYSRADVCDSSPSFSSSPCQYLCIQEVWCTVLMHAATGLRSQLVKD